MQKGQTFKQKYTFQQRSKQCNEQKAKAVDMIPIILEKDSKSNIQPLDKKKYIAHSNYTLFQFLETLKKKFAGKIKKSESICFYVAGKVIESGAMKDVYNTHRDKDGFLYITYGTLQAF